MQTRDELFQLVASLPEDALMAAHGMLTQLQTWPPPELAALDEAGHDFEKRVEERIAQMRERHPLGGGVGFDSFSLGPGGVGERRGRHSTGYEHAGESVHASEIVYDECEFTLVERIKREPASRTVTFTMELTGPDGTPRRHQHSFDLP